MLETALFDEFYGGKSYETKTGSTFDSLQEVEETDQEQAQLTLLERIDRIVKIHSFIHKRG